MSDTLLLAAFVMSTIACLAWIVTVGVVAFVLYWFVYLPWGVMRKDVKALADRLAGMESRAKVSMMDDAEVARTEARLLARQRARATQEGLR